MKFYYASNLIDMQGAYQIADPKTNSRINLHSSITKTHLTQRLLYTPLKCGSIFISAIRLK